MRLPTTAALALALAGALSLPGPAAGQEPVPMVTDRPDFTESAVSVAPGTFQFELGYTFSRTAAEERHSFGELLARVGILSWLEGRIGMNSFALLRGPAEDRSGLEDLTLSVKAVLHRKTSGSAVAVPQVALLAGVDVPTGDGEFGESEMQPGAKVAASWELSPRLLVGSNAGWAYLYAEGERFHQGVASLAVGFVVTQPLTAYAEWYGLFPENRGGGANHYVNVGFAWLLGPDLQLDWRIGAGLQDPSPNWFSGLGVSFRL